MTNLKRKLRARIGSVLRNAKSLRPLRIDVAVQAETEVGQSIENLQVLWPAQEKISLGANENEQKFLRISKYFNDGYYSRPNIFVCEVPQAYCHIGTGLVCTRDWKAVSDSQMEYRLASNRNFKWFKPFRPLRLTGSHYSTINNVFVGYWQHWLVDCLTRLYSLSMAYPDQRIVILTPAGLKRDWNESLTAALPPHFEVRNLPADSWVHVDRLLLPSYVSARANQHLPTGYYETMRKTTFKRLGLPPNTEPHERIYISRGLAVRRRVLNEAKLVLLLARYGFKSITPEKMQFKDQVDLFRRAAIVASPYGSNWANTIYSGNIKSLVFYGDRPPETHVFTFAKALGQEHFFVAGYERHVDCDFEVDLAAVERVLQDEMNLRPV